MSSPPVLGAARFPAWHAHPDVWLLLGLLATCYAVAVVRLGPRWAPPGGPAVTRAQVIWFSLGVATLWLAADWPIHDVAEHSMYSVHMVQHLLFSLVAAPLLLLGTPAWMLRALLRPEPVFRVVRRLARFLPAILLYNLVLVLAHWPAVVDATLRSHPLHFLAHAVILVTALIVWLPVLSPLPEIPRLAPPQRMVFLFLQSVVPTVPASFLTFGRKPLYHFYEHVPQLWGTTLDDQRTAGLIMKLGAGLLIWITIAVIFFRWAAEEESSSRPRRQWQDLDRELTESAARSG